MSCEKKEKCILAGKNALITGSAIRLGKAIATRLAEEKINLVLHYNRSEKEVHQLAHHLEQYNIKVIAIQSDLTQPDAPEVLFERSVNALGTIDILINNASFFPENNIFNFSYTDLEKSVLIHAWAPLQLSRFIYLQGTDSHIINILDTRLWGYDRNHASYYLGKQLLRIITKVTALEFAPRVRVNAIAPGLILPPAGKTEDYLKELSHTNPLHTYGHPIDVVNAVMFILTSSFMTGQVLFLDGGRNLLGYGNYETL